MNKLLNLYKNISIDTWDRLEFTNKTKSKFSEITITENILYTIDKYRIENSDDSIQMYESKDESTNGNDLEVYIELEKDKYIFLAIQAKKLYIDSQKYKAITHKVDSQYQIDLLLNYAKLKEGIPLYLLYNYAPNFIHKNKKLYGCSILKADYIYKKFYPNKSTKWKIPTFKQLHTKNAIPLFILGRLRCFKNFIKSNYPTLKKYKVSELVDNTWVKVENIVIHTGKFEQLLIRDIDYKVEQKNSLDVINREEKVFKPKFKVIITQDR